MPTLVNNLRAIRGPVTAVPMVGQSGVVVEADTQNNQVVVRADETVLWSGSKALTAMNGSANAITLSGSLYDYEKVAIYARPIASHEELKVAEFAPDSQAEGFDWLLWFKGGGTGGAGAIRFGCAFIQHNANQMWVKTDELFQLSLTSTGISFQGNQNILTRVVGINRIANN